ncbi:MAG: response regulator [Parvibaculum sp.]|nr:response regulator [Parvibaculum sp.]
MIIDDEPLVRKTTRLVLEANGHSIVEASDGREGMQAFGLQKFDLVITDVLMPNQDGLETLDAIHSVDSSTKVLCISGGGRSGNREFLKIAEKLGADGVLPKPFSMEALIAKVAELCA